MNLIYGTFCIFPALSLQNTLQNTDSNSISVYSENNAYLNIYLLPIRDKQHKVCSMHLTKRCRFLGISMEDFGVLWVWGFCGDSHGILLWVWDGMGTEIQSPRQPCQLVMVSHANGHTPL